MKYFILLFVICATNVLAQQRYLVSPNNELFPIRNGTSASSIIESYTRSGATTNTESGVIFGYPPETFSTKTYLGAFHKDVVGQWYISKAAGTLDTIYWWAGSNGAKDSLVFVLLRHSSLGPDYGPGVGKYVNAPPCQNWGYWLNSLDKDGGIAAFANDATDTTWYSTINEQGGSIPKTRPFSWMVPFAPMSFGKIHRRGLNKVAILDAGEPCSLRTGDKFFIFFRVNSANEHPAGPEIPTEFGVWQSNVPLTTNDENWPSRVWKFYQHDSGPSNCAGNPTESVKRGWVARGPFIDSPDFTSMLNIWYSMTVSTNTPPRIAYVPGGDPENTSSTLPQTITCEISDTDPFDPESAYVQSAFIEWWKSERGNDMNFVRQTDIPMANTGPGDIWTGTLPGMQPGDAVTYRIKATDAKGMSATGREHTFKIIFEKSYFWIDTNSVSCYQEIGPSPIDIPHTDFFLPSNSCPDTHPGDDGTAGPFPLGAGMPFLSDTMHYLWIGVNGAIALSDDPIDTIHLNARGRYHGVWDIPPADPPTQYDGNCEVIFAPPLPKNFIAPFWSDLILAGEGDTPETYGHIRYGNGADTNLFIIEWDSIGFKKEQSVADNITFRIVLNRFDGSVQYQYENIGTHGADSLSLIGLYRDEEYAEGRKYGYVFLNKNGHPAETRPRNNWCVTLWPGAPLYVEAGWQLLSLSYDRGADSNYCLLFPPLCDYSEAFRYSGSYQPELPHPKNGTGYWIKFSERKYAGAPGLPIYDMISGVALGWNMIGTISKPVLTANIQTDPPDMVTSEFFGYDSQYYLAGALLPGKGYWVKIDRSGYILLHDSSFTLHKESDPYQHLNRIIVSDRSGNKQTLFLANKGKCGILSLYEGELPPAMPEFDARFSASGGMVAVYPDTLSSGIEYEYPLTVTTGNLPLTIEWLMVDPPDRTPCITLDKRVVCRLVDKGSVKIPATEKLAIAFRDEDRLPTEFALRQNYPNPFNPVTMIQYELPVAVHVHLKIYSLLGQEVATLIDTPEEPGYHEILWDASSHAGGVYFIKFTAGDYKKVMKVLLIK